MQISRRSSYLGAERTDSHPYFSGDQPHPSVRAIAFLVIISYPAGAPIAVLGQGDKEGDRERSPDRDAS